MLETLYRIYDDNTSDYIEVGPDADTGELLELRTYSYNSLTANWDIGQRISIDHEQIPLLIQILEKHRKV